MRSQSKGIGSAQPSPVGAIRFYSMPSGGAYGAVRGGLPRSCGAVEDGRPVGKISGRELPARPAVRQGRFRSSHIDRRSRLRAKRKPPPLHPHRSTSRVDRRIGVSRKPVTPADESLPTPCKPRDSRPKDLCGCRLAWRAGHQVLRWASRSPYGLVCFWNRMAPTGQPKLQDRLNRLLLGWAGYFSFGFTSNAYDAVGWHVRAR